MVILGYQLVKYGFGDIECAKIGILGYLDIDSSRMALDGWIRVFRNRDIGISDPLYRGPNALALVAFVRLSILLSICVHSTDRRTVCVCL